MPLIAMRDLWQAIITICKNTTVIDRLTLSPLRTLHQKLRDGRHHGSLDFRIDSRRTRRLDA